MTDHKKVNFENWRVSLNTNKYSNFFRIIESIPEDELHEALNILEKVLPRRTWGDGVETYEDVIHPNEIDFDENHLNIWFGVNSFIKIRNLIFNNQSNLTKDIFIVSRNLALNALEDSDIKYEGLANTYFYLTKIEKGQIKLRDGRNSYRQISKARFEKIRRLKPNLSPNEYVEWEIKYLWRMSFSLNKVFETGDIEPFTELWHAINILIKCEKYENIISINSGKKISENIQKIFDLDDLYNVASLSLEIGKSHDALIKKKIEKKGISSENAQKSGTNKTKNIAEKQKEICKDLVSIAMKANRYIFTSSDAKERAKIIQKIAEEKFANSFQRSGKILSVNWFQKKIEDMNADGTIKKIYDKNNKKG